MGGDWPNLHVAWNSWGVTVLHGMLWDAMGIHGDSLIPCQLHQAAPDTVNRRTRWHSFGGDSMCSCHVFAT